MTEARELHRQAMDLAERAADVRAAHRAADAIPLLREALAKERAAAEAFERERDSEPTRSVLFRSAASLALGCGDYDEAERLAAAGLGGHPPVQVAAELRDLIDEIHLHGSLKRRGIVLDDREFQVSLQGDAIGTGIAESDEFITRIADLEKLIYRTAERKSGHPFRSRGRRRARIASQVETFLSVPRAGSFSVTLRIGYPEQMDLPGMSIAKTVIDEVFECLRLFEACQLTQLGDRISDGDYFRNFVALVKGIAPDGEAVRKVGFASIEEGEEREVVLSRTRDSVTLVEADLVEATTRRERVEVRGTLKFADRLKEASPEIRVQDAEGKKHAIRVPAALMDDIVRPLWDYEVVVSGWKEGRKIVLEDIRRADDESA